ncbi:PREDICTED: nodulin-related protein 1-like [Ipomoea nil]|uniref:nodulin-related protein 1-like n=1 Tax=Ipomoea nil TaxID=35883 RepID=UPI000900BEA9|nr:PREDICTED: nodulin-related protein 1-like [Ipomoea nil]
MDSRGHNEGSHAKPGQSSHHNHPAPTKAELMSSAKLLGEAAKSTLHHDPNKPNKADKAELAGAAADLLNAASHYGKLEEKGMGKYVGKAEDYLHKYHTSHSQTATATAGSTHHSTAAAQHAHSSGHSGGNHHSGGYGEYIKMAEGIFNKHESSTTTTSQSHSGNKYGEYAKMAGDFLKKH